MINFEAEIYNVIKSTYLGIIIASNSNQLPYLIITLPEKALAFHLVSLPRKSEAIDNPNFFADLSNQYALKNIRLIHVWEDFWLLQRPIIESRIRLMLGNFVRIHARQTHVQRIDKPALDAFLLNNHLYGSPSTKYKYGLFYMNDLVAVASFSAIRTYWRNQQPSKSAELVRFANLKGHAIAGGLSKLLAYFIREQHPDDIMSYADRDWSDGRSYELLGFKKIEVTPPQMFWVHPQTLMRYTINKLPAYLLSEFRQQNQIMLIDDFLKEKKFMPVYNSGNIKYLLYK